MQVERTLANNGKPKGKPQYYLPIFDTIVDTKCFPLSYNLYDAEADLEPDPNVYCDFPSCTRRDTDTIVRLACFHCFHQACLSSHDCCPICLVPLKKKVQKLANTFNNGLLTSNETDAIENNADVHNEECISTPASMSVTEAQSFYSSTEWAVKIDSTLNSYAPIPLPSQPNHSTPNHSSVPTTPDVPPSNSSPPVLTPIIIPPHHNVNVTYWSFPYIISQSTILGRVGSNACTFIALLFSKMFFSPNVDIPVTESPLSQTWVYQIVIQGILAGNSIYDSLTDTPQTFGVLEVLQASTVLNNAIGHTTVGPELPVSIVPERTATASLPFYWRQALAQGHTTSIFILSSNTVAFIPTTQGIFLLDSHLHGNSGAHVAFASWQHSFELLSWFKEINNFQYTLGTVTNVKFH